MMRIPAVFLCPFLVWFSLCAGLFALEFTSFINPQMCPKEGSLALIDAVMEGDAERVDALLCEGVVPDSLLLPLGNAPFVDTLYPLLSFVAATGDITIAKLLIDAGANVNERFLLHGVHFESTALFMAVAGDDPRDYDYNPKVHLEMVRLLLEEGADVSFVNELKQTALHRLVMVGLLFIDSEVVGLLLSYGVDINARDVNGDTALHEAACRGVYYYNICEFLLKHGAQVDVRDNRGETPFFKSASATYMDNKWTLLLLVENGAQVDTFNEEGKTPLLSVVRVFNQYSPNWFHSGFPSSIEVLLELGADANFVESATGETALLQILDRPRADDVAGAAEEEYDAVKTLLAYGANANVVDSRGRAPILLAIESGRIDIAELLIEHGVRADAVDSRGETLLFPLLRSLTTPVSIEILELLVKHGLDPSVVADNGDTAFSVAVGRENYDAAIVLLGYVSWSHVIQYYNKIALFQAWSSYTRPYWGVVSMGLSSCMFVLSLVHHLWLADSLRQGWRFMFSYEHFFVHFELAYAADRAR